MFRAPWRRPQIPTIQGGPGAEPAAGDPMSVPPLRIGFIGSGFIAKFHLKSFESVRNAQITGVFSPTPAKRQALADAVNAAELGPCTAHDSLEALITAPDVDAIWLLSP